MEMEAVKEEAGVGEEVDEAYALLYDQPRQ